MRTLKYYKNGYTTDQAHQIALDIETELGLKIMNDNPQNPNDVYGFVNTCSDGTVEVHVYDLEDIQAIENHPDFEHPITGKIVKTKTSVPRKNCPLTDSQLKIKIDKALKVKHGFLEHQDHADKKKKILKSNQFGLILD